MDTKDIDEYLEKIRSTQDKEEQLNITSEFFLKLNEWVIDERSYLESYFEDHDNITEICQYLFDSGAFDICYDIGYDTIPDLARKFKILARNAELIDVSINEEKYTNKILNTMRNLLSSGNLLDENGQIKDFDFFDVILSQCISIHIFDNIPFDDVLKDSINKLSRRLPDKMNILESKTWMISENLKSQEMLKYIEMKPEEYYWEQLTESKFDYLDSDGNPIDTKKYDQLLYEYLLMYYQEKEVSDRIDIPFEKLINNAKVGTLSKLKTYKEFFLKSVESDGNYRESIERILISHNQEIATDIIERLHENEENEKQSECSSYEFLLFEGLYMDQVIDTNEEAKLLRKTLKKGGIDLLSIEEVLAKLADDGRIKDGKLKQSGILNQYMENMTSSHRNLEQAVQYVIRLQKIFKKKNRPDGNMGKIYDFLSGIDTANLLKNNLDVKKIESGDKAYIRNAEIALGFICQRDLSQALELFSDVTLINSLKKVGIDIYQTKAMDKFVEVYVNEFGLDKSLDSRANRLLENYISSRASRPDFNILKEQGVSDLIQLSDTNKTKFDFRAVMLQSMMSAKNFYGPSKSKKIADEFIAKYGELPVDPESANEFNDFVKSLSTLKINNKGMLEQKYVDFILSQALREDSILNINKGEYGYVVDRAIEDLAKIDFMKQNNGLKPTYMYVTRNYLDHDNTLGLHNSQRKIITIRKSQIDKVYNGKADVFNTIFHENQHMNQYKDFRRMPSSFMRYNMLKEQVVMDCNVGYYTRNYSTTYIEIEAREKGNEMAAEYLAKIMPTERVGDSIEQLGDEVSELLSNKFDKEKERLLQQSNEEKKLYEDADEKLDKSGNRRTLQSIFESTVSEHLMASKIKEYPGLLIEYNENGKRKNFFELLSFADSQCLNLEMVQQIIKSSCSMEQGDTIDILYGIINYINNNGNDAKKCDFMKNVLSENCVGFINKVLKDLSSKPYLRDDDLRVYNTIQSIINVAKNEGSIYNDVFSQNSGKNKVTPLYCLEFYQKSVEERFPTIKVNANSIKQRDEEQRRLKERLDAERRERLKQNSRFNKKKKGLRGIFNFSYKDVKEISDEADILGKKTVLNYEKSLERTDRTKIDL